MSTAPTRAPVSAQHTPGPRVVGSDGLVVTIYEGWKRYSVSLSAVPELTTIDCRYPLKLRGIRSLIEVTKPLKEGGPTFKKLEAMAWAYVRAINCQCVDCRAGDCCDDARAAIAKATKP